VTSLAQLERGVVGYWCPMLATTGLRLYDRSGRKNHGTLTNMNADSDWLTAKVRNTTGRVLDFDGINDHIPITNFRSVPRQNRLTSSAWVRFAGTATRIEIIHFIGFNGDNTAFFLYRNPTGKLVSEFGDGTGAATGATTISGGSWNLLTATYDGAVNRVYLNGVLDASTSYVSGNISKQQIMMSAYYQDNIGGTTPLLPLIGQNAESCVWNRAITASEIRTLYRLGPGWFGKRERRRRYAVAGAATTNRRRRILIGASS
jgi:hypothetical protein